MTAKNPEKIVPVFDPHNNFLLELDYRSKEERPFERHWLQHLIDGGVKVQVCAVNVCYRPPAEKLGAALRQIAAFHRAVAEAGDQVTCIRTSEDLDRVLAGDSIGLVLALEGVDIMDGDLELLEAVWELGVRWFGLTWNYSNTYAGAFGDGNGRGLSDQGRELVKQLQERGGVIDLAHASPETVSDVLALEHMIPPVVTHSACQAVFDSPRNMTDDQLREMAVAGGCSGSCACHSASTPRRRRWSGSSTTLTMPGPSSELAASVSAETFTARWPEAEPRVQTRPTRPSR